MADSNLVEPFLGANNAIVKHWAHSKSKLHRIQFTWTIDNFSFRQEKIGEQLDSPLFSADDDSSQWRIQLYPKGESEAAKEYLSLYLNLSSESSKKSNIPAKFKFFILNVEPEKTYSNGETQVPYFNTSVGWGIKHFMKLKTLLDEANGFLTEDQLTLLCEVCFVSENINYSDQKNNDEFEVPQCSLIDDLKNLFNNSKFSDVTLVVGEHEFHAHKAILAARSDVFAAMFEHEMKDNKLNIVTVTDVKHEVLQEMLHFIYTGVAPKTNEMAIHLLAAADKYALQKLKVISEKALFADLSIETAVETLVLADLHSATQLKELTIRFINTHAKAVIKTKGWQNMISANVHSLLIAELFEALFREHDLQI